MADVEVEPGREVVGPSEAISDPHSGPNEREAIGDQLEPKLQNAAKPADRNRSDCVEQGTYEPKSEAEREGEPESHPIAKRKQGNGHQEGHGVELQNVTVMSPKNEDRGLSSVGPVEKSEAPSGEHGQYVAEVALQAPPQQLWNDGGEAGRGDSPGIDQLQHHAEHEDEGRSGGPCEDPHGSELSLGQAGQDVEVV